MEDVEEDEEEGNHEEEDDEEVGERLRRGRAEGERRKRRLKVRNKPPDILNTLRFY
jgi:hypothetical protein